MAWRADAVGRLLMGECSPGKAALGDVERRNRAEEDGGRTSAPRFLSRTPSAW
jgi:hypothetical protein